MVKSIQLANYSESTHTCVQKWNLTRQNRWNSLVFINSNIKINKEKCENKTSLVNKISKNIYEPQNISSKKARNSHQQSTYAPADSPFKIKQDDIYVSNSSAHANKVYLSRTSTNLSNVHMEESIAKINQIKTKIQHCREDNQLAVIDEKKRKNILPRNLKQGKNLWDLKSQKMIRNELDKLGLEKNEYRKLLTAEKAAFIYEKEDKKKENAEVDQFSKAALFRVEAKRCQFVSHTKGRNEQKEEKQYQFVLEENIDNMVSELEQQVDTRNRFSRRRKYRLDKDIDSINERNASFNRKLSRVLDNYTKESQENLVNSSVSPGT